MASNNEKLGWGAALLVSAVGACALQQTPPPAEPPEEPKPEVVLPKGQDRLMLPKGFGGLVVPESVKAAADDNPCRVVEKTQDGMNVAMREALSESAVEVAERFVENKAKEAGIKIKVLRRTACFKGSLVYEAGIYRILIQNINKEGALHGTLDKSFDTSKTNTVVLVEVKDLETGEEGEVFVALCGLSVVGAAGF